MNKSVLLLNNQYLKFEIHHFFIGEASIVKGIYLKIYPTVNLNLLKASVRSRS